MRILIIAVLVVLSLTVTLKPAFYYYDEARTGNKCKDEWECNGMRTCSLMKWCEGTAGSAVSPKPAGYFFNESQKGYQCANHMQCTGRRVCTNFNWCAGTA